MTAPVRFKLSFLGFVLTFLLLCGAVRSLTAAPEQLPPPSDYVTDQVGVIPRAELSALNAQLGAFERATSNQIFVYVFSELPNGMSIDQYAQQLYSAWHIGQKKLSNGVLVLVSVKNRKSWIQTGYGLEGALPDAVCSRITREVMAPAFRKGQYSAGVAAGIQAVIQATKGEYKGRGPKSGKSMGLLDLLFSPLGFFLLVLVVLILSGRNRRGGGGGISPGAAAATGFFLGGAGGGWRGGGSGGGDGFSGGGGGDSGGGGGGGDW